MDNKINLHRDFLMKRENRIVVSDENYVFYLLQWDGDIVQRTVLEEPVLASIAKIYAQE